VQRNRSFVVGDRTIANQAVIDNPQLELLIILPIPVADYSALVFDLHREALAQLSHCYDIV
jgi:hypothetical protein